MDQYWIGIDTGGTFTDLALKNATKGTWFYYKVPTWTEEPAKAILDGISEMLDKASVDASSVEYVVLGTTKATNAVLEGTWARTGMITTRGFADVLDIARQRRPHYFNIDLAKPVPPARRSDRYEATERVGADGAVIDSLDEDDVLNAIAQLKASGVESVAVCFMHSYANAAHESRALELVRQHWPQTYACASADILPEVREYERFITTAVNASLMPVMDKYLDKFEQGARDLGMSKRIRVMQSNGGAVSTASVRKLPINTFFSGPAGGIMAAVEIGRQTGFTNLIGLDMGGTSTDVCLIKNGRPSMKHERSMGGMPVRTPSLDIHTIGAGGGSVSWLDEGGLLKVGPRSAGAYPGPAAYGRGGEEPTVTDANVVLGRLNPATLLDGRMAVYPEKAKAAIHNRLCTATDFDELQAAVGIVAVANVHMTGAVRQISVEQGEDPRDYALVAFGGAGPLHAAEIAQAAGITHIIVPPHPGVLSAQGLLQASRRADFGRTCLVLSKAASADAVNEGFRDLLARVAQWKADESIDQASPLNAEWILEMRYFGQSSDLAISVDEPRVDAQEMATLAARFNERHKDLFGYDMPGRDIEISQVRVAVVQESPPGTSVPAVEKTGGEPGFRTRSVWFVGAGFVDTPVLRRECIEPNTHFNGPAIVEQMDSTTVVPPEAQVRCDDLGYLHIMFNKTHQEGTQE